MAPIHLQIDLAEVSQQRSRFLSLEVGPPSQGVGHHTAAGHSPGNHGQIIQLSFHIYLITKSKSEPAKPTNQNKMSHKGLCFPNE